MLDFFVDQSMNSPLKSRRLFLTIFVPFILFLVSCAPQQNESDRQSNQPVEPFKIIGNVYYVGASEVTSFLITTPDGHFLLDSGFAETVPQIRDNVKKLGFKLEDIKFLLNSQSHYDHAGGLSELKKLTGAQMVASEGDRESLEKGDHDNFAWGDTKTYAPVKVDRTVKDGEALELGGVKMNAVVTPGHTRGCTTWTLTVDDGGKPYNVVFVCSASVPGYTLVGNEKYPNIIADYETTFTKLKLLKPDVFLAAHGSFFDLLGKAEKLRNGAAPNPFIDPAGYNQYVIDAEKTFRDQVAQEKISR